jgi:hypothetical protein
MFHQLGYSQPIHRRKSWQLLVLWLLNMRRDFPELLRCDSNTAFHRFRQHPIVQSLQYLFLD